MKLKNESGFDFMNHADSIWNRLSNKKPKGGKSIQQMLGIEDEGMEPLGGRNKLSLMDIVNDMYEQGDSYEEED